MKVTTNNGAEVEMDVPENMLVIKQQNGSTHIFHNPDGTAALQILILQELVWLNIQIQTLTNRV